MSGTNPLRRALWPTDPPGAKPSMLSAVRRVGAGAVLVAVLWLVAEQQGHER